MATNPILYARTKHVELDFYFIRERIADQTIRVQYVPSLDQKTDIFTKPLSQQFFTRLRQYLHIIPLSSLELKGMLAPFQKMNNTIL